MRVAQVAPLYESCPPKLYGGTERVVSWLTEELVAQGHDVTLFASGDSRTTARLIEATPRSLRLDETVRDAIAHHMAMFDQVISRQGEFDIIHFHTDYLHFPLTRLLSAPTLTTLHGRLDLPDLAPIAKRFKDVPIVSISDAQRRPQPGSNWKGTVYHGLPSGLLSLGRGNGDYLAFVGRICAEKRLDRAIRIAQAVGMTLKVAAKIDAADRAYFEKDIAPLLNSPGIEFIGEIGDDQKSEFLGKARALLFPIDWPEPFGLVMIEAMACGTPVLAFPNGSVPEVIDEGVTGVVVATVEEGIAALPRLLSLDRSMVRRRFEERFTANRMASGYLSLYRTLTWKGLPSEALEGAAVIPVFPDRIAASPA